MNQEVLLALIFKKVEERLKSLPQHSRGPRGQRGSRGSDGKDGRGFVFSEHQEFFRDLAKNSALKIEDLSADEIEKLRGPRGRDGHDGKSFDFSQHEETIRDWARQFALKFEDLSAEQIEELRGSKGRDGRDGKDGHSINFSDHEEKIRNWTKEFSLKFADLSADQIELLRGPRGRDGHNGLNGKDFIFSDHEETIRNWTQEFSLKFADLSADQIEQLRGSRGRDGRDGKDGKSFNFSDHEQDIKNWAHEFALKFSDLTVEEIEKLRGPKGRDGRDGKDFDFESSRELITEVVRGLITDTHDSFKLKFQDLTAEEIEKIRGPRGRDGRDGKNFIFEEHRDFFQSLKPKFSEFTDVEISQLMLRFSHLTEEEKDRLKLHFKDLSEEDRASLRGARGHRGQKGAPGKDGVDGKDGKSIRGLPGPIGLRGFKGIGQDGRNGKDGTNGIDAPHIVEITTEQNKKDEFSLVFDFSDGTSLRSGPVKIPVPNNVYVTGGGGVTSTSSGTGSGAGGTTGKTRKVEALVGVFALGDTTYTLPEEPISDDELMVWINGVMRTDYTLTADQVVFSGQDTTGQVFDAQYRFEISAALTATRKMLGVTGVFAAGDTTYTLLEDPETPDDLLVWLDGVMRTDYVLTGLLVVFPGLDTTTTIFDAQYRYGVSAINSTARNVIALAGVFALGDTTYTLPETPIDDEELVVWLNGVLRTDYTVVGGDVTFIGQDTTGQVFDAHYRF